jgi:hypothetical protein
VALSNVCKMISVMMSLRVSLAKHQTHHVRLLSLVGSATFGNHGRPTDLNESLDQVQRSKLSVKF